MTKPMEKRIVNVRKQIYIKNRNGGSQHSEVTNVISLLVGPIAPAYFFVSSTET
jgi:hypothetical protein